MAKTREIKKRIKAVANIRRITKTMQMIATSKFAKAQQRATATKPFTEGVFELVTELGGAAGNLSHPLITGLGAKAANAPDLILVITSDRGLCGAYNGTVLRKAQEIYRELRGANRQIRTELVGKKGAAFLKFIKVNVDERHVLGDTPRYEEVERLAQKYMDMFQRGEVASVRVVYMRFLSAGRQAPEALQLLPMRPPKGKKAEGAAEQRTVVYEFTPSATELLDELLPTAVKTTLFQAFNDAIVSEHIARMVAMKSATDAAGKMGKLLTRKYNRARQAQITTELTEIVTGAAALE
jgi:F-type H+-transporting ATPase subunit gamma